MTAEVFLHLYLAVTMLASVPALTPAAEGWVTPAADGVFERVMRRRIRWQQIDPRWGYIPECLCALNENYIGRYAVIFYRERPEGEMRARLLCLVVDVAQERHAAVREAKRLAVEVDWGTWKRWGRGPVVVAVLEAGR